MVVFEQLFDSMWELSCYTEGAQEVAITKGPLLDVVGLDSIRKQLKLAFCCIVQARNLVNTHPDDLVPLVFILENVFCLLIPVLDQAFFARWKLWICP